VLVVVYSAAEAQGFRVMVRVSLVIRYIGKIFSVAEVIFRVFLAECSAAEAPGRPKIE